MSLINTLRAYAPHPRLPGTPWLGGGTGGLSGPAIRAVALAQVRAVARRVSIPIVGMGGVQTGRHAAQLLDAGATLVAVGTESFRDPAAGTRIATRASRFVRKERGHREPTRRCLGKKRCKYHQNRQPV